MVVSWNRSTPSHHPFQWDVPFFTNHFGHPPFMEAPRQQHVGMFDVHSASRHATPGYCNPTISCSGFGTCDPISARLSRDLPQWLKSCQSCLSFMEDAEKMVVHLNGSERMWHRLAPMGTVFLHQQWGAACICDNDRFSSDCSGVCAVPRCSKSICPSSVLSKVFVCGEAAKLI